MFPFLQRWIGRADLFSCRKQLKNWQEAEYHLCLNTSSYAEERRKTLPDLKENLERRVKTLLLVFFSTIC
jgi:hypothetical protein